MATATLKCPNCGGGLKFDPEKQKSVCEYCLSTFTSEELAAATLAAEAKAERAARTEAAAGSAVAGTETAAQGSEGHLAGYICDSCGAEVVTEATTSATFCFYCHNPVLITSRLTGEFQPHKIIPFQYDRDKAIATFRHWAKSHRFVPHSFYSASQLEKMTGLYLPYWMADYDAQVDFAAQAVVRRVWVSGNTEFTEHKDFAIARKGNIEVDHIHELAHGKIDRSLIEAIAPFDEAQATDFNLSYLSGFLAEKYDIERGQVEPMLESRARDYASSLLRESISGYSEVHEQKNQVDLALKNWFYALFPAWVMTYRYHGKTYIYAINGQTGKAYGELPVSNQRLGVASAILAAIILVLAILGGLWLW